MARALGTDHHVVEASYTDIGRVFPEVVWHAETPLLRSAPAPMFLLSKLVEQQNFKVVLTGEGADEFLAGYDLFKEAKVRRFWAQQPRSLRRPLLFKRLYPWMPGLSEGNPGYLAAFFGIGLQDVDDPAYSHAVRWRTTGRTRRFSAPSCSRHRGGGGRGADELPGCLRSVGLAAACAVCRGNQFSFAVSAVIPGRSNGDGTRG